MHDALPQFASRDHYSQNAREVFVTLDERVSGIVQEVLASEVWRALTGHETPIPLVRAILRELFLSIAQYQPHTTEAGFHMLGRLPKDEERLLSALVHHKCEEAPHGEWARRDYLLCGGSESTLRQPADSTAFAVAAVWWRMAHTEEPFGYLGAEYLFESLTMRVAPVAREALEARGFEMSRVAFIVEHATEDVKHTNLITHFVLDVATRHPGGGAAMVRCFDYFAHVYPLPLWDEVLRRAQATSEAP